MQDSKVKQIYNVYYFLLFEKVKSTLVWILLFLCITFYHEFTNFIIKT